MDKEIAEREKQDEVDKKEVINIKALEQKALLEKEKKALIELYNSLHEKRVDYKDKIEDYINILEDSEDEDEIQAKKEEMNALKDEVRQLERDLERKKNRIARKTKL